VEKVETAHDAPHPRGSGFHLGFQGGGTGSSASLSVPPDGTAAALAPSNVFFWFAEAAGGPPSPTDIPPGFIVLEQFKLLGPVHIAGKDWKQQTHPHDTYPHDVWVLLLAPQPQS
jgi:hypothetical protein